MLQDLSWRAAALIASVSLHLALLLTWSERALVSVEQTRLPPNELFVQISFAQAHAQSVMPVEQPPPPKPPPEPQPKPKPKPQPKPKPVTKPKPAPTPVEEPPATEPELAQTPPPPPTASRRQSDLRNAFLSELMAKIEEHKFYPSVARRRNLQGTIQVRFRLGCRGEVQALEISGEHSLLRKAAGKAIEAAIPLPQIPAEIQCPMRVDYAMAYTLEQ